MVRKLLFLLLIIGIAGMTYAAYMWFKPHEDVSTAKAFASFGAVGLMSDFKTTRDSMDNLLSGKVILLEGEVKRSSADGGLQMLTFDNGGDFIVQAYESTDGDAFKNYTGGEVVRLKGLYAGYLAPDESLFIPGEIKLEQCYVVQ